MPQIGGLQPDSMEDRRRKACFSQRKTTKAILVMRESGESNESSADRALFDGPVSTLGYNEGDRGQ